MHDITGIVCGWKKRLVVKYTYKWVVCNEIGHFLDARVIVESKLKTEQFVCHAIVDGHVLEGYAIIFQFDLEVIEIGKINELEKMVEISGKIR